jgi:hypothetical protein
MTDKAAAVDTVEQETAAIPAATRRDCFLPRTRCTTAELAVIQQRAASVRMTESAYLRHMALHGRIVVKEAKADVALIQELNRIGVNLNQMARAINATGGMIPPELAKTMATVETVLFSLMGDA